MKRDPWGQLTIWGKEGMNWNVAIIGSPALEMGGYGTATAVVQKFEI